MRESRNNKPEKERSVPKKSAYGKSKPSSTGRSARDSKSSSRSGISYKRTDSDASDTPKSGTFRRSPSADRRGKSEDEKRPYKRSDASADKKSGSTEKRPFSRRSDDGDRKSRAGGADRALFKKDGERERRNRSGNDDRPFVKRDSPQRARPGRSDSRFSSDKSDQGERRGRPTGKPGFSKDKKPFTKSKIAFKRVDDESSGDRDPARRSERSDSRPTSRGKFADKKRPFSKPEKDQADHYKARRSSPEYSKPADRKRPSKSSSGGKGKYPDKRNVKPEKIKSLSTTEPVRLNRYISNSGVCSRRDADKLIADGNVMVNDVVVTALGTKINPGDKVILGGKTLRPEKFVYVLLNKPKDFITTTDDPYERKTVMHLVSKACEERIYPVGRLDRNTTGLLLFTNDGELSKRLSHPRYMIKKIYSVKLDRNFERTDFDKVLKGVTLKDGSITVDELAYSPGEKNVLGVALHSGRNRIVRRLFEHLGYNVVGLDRVYFAGLTKKDVPRGKYRMLKPKEISMLKMIGGKQSIGQ